MGLCASVVPKRQKLCQKLCARITLKSVLSLLNIEFLSKQWGRCGMEHVQSIIHSALFVEKNRSKSRGRVFITGTFFNGLKLISKQNF